MAVLIPSGMILGLGANAAQATVIVAMPASTALSKGLHVVNVL
jgi:hypothetical protein